MKKFLKFCVAFLVLGLALTGCSKDDLGKNDIVRNIDGETATGAAIMVMDTAMVSSKLQRISQNGTLTFNNLAAEDMPIKGDIICSAPSRTAPQGFLYKVRDVMTKGVETTIVTEMATIEEAVKKASVNQSVDLKIADIENAGGVEIEQLRQAPNSQLRAANDLTLTALKLKVDIPLEDGSKHIKGDIELKTTFHFEMNFEGWALKHLLLTTKPQFKAKLAATIESKIEKEIPFHITTLKFNPVTVFAGVVPVVFVPKLSIDAILTLKGEVKVQATLIDWDYSFTFGSRYDNGTFTSISENTSKPAKYLEDLQLVLSGEVKLQPQLSYYYDLYNTGSNVGVLGNFYSKLEVKDNVGSNTKLSFSCGLEFEAKAELEIFSNTIGKWKLTFCSLDWLIWEKNWEGKEDTPLAITSPSYGTTYRCGDWIDIFVSGYKGSDWQDYLELQYWCLVGEPQPNNANEPSTYTNKAYTRKETSYSFTFSPETPSVWEGHWAKLVAINKKNNTRSAPQYVRILPHNNSEIVGVWKGSYSSGTVTLTINEDMTGVFDFIHNNGCAGSYKVSVEYSNEAYNVRGTEWINNPGFCNGSVGWFFANLYGGVINNGTLSGPGFRLEKVK